MAITTLTDEVPERGTQILTVAFLDEDGAATTASTIVTSLTDGTGTVVNSHTADARTAGTTITTVYTADDHDLTTNKGDSERIYLVRWVYTSDAGTALPGAAQRRYYISNQVKAN